MKDCENCDVRKMIARAFDCHWFDDEDCPMECPYDGEEKQNDDDTL